VTFSPEHDVQALGYLKLGIPGEFVMSESTAVAYFTVVELLRGDQPCKADPDSDTDPCVEGSNMVSISAVSAGAAGTGAASYLRGIVSTGGLNGGAYYRATIGGLRNPRRVATSLAFTLTTFGPAAFDDEQIAAQHEIDKKVGGTVDVDKVSPLISFAAMSRDPTNGREATYSFSWFTDVRTEAGDMLYIVLPPEIRIPPIGSSDKKELVCKGTTGLAPNGVTCKDQRVQPGTRERICNDS
jgi:hypothetical protein